MSTIYLLLTSPRLPAGLLTKAAWGLLDTHPVYAGAEAEISLALADNIADLHRTEDPADVIAAVRSRDIVWLVESDGTDGAFTRRLAGLVAAEHEPPTLETVYGSYDPPGARLLDVVDVMDQLRSPGGCPWDAEQTHASLMKYLLEEAYEAYDALDSGDADHIVEELGDLLLQVVFHARLAQEDPEGWTIDDVAAGLVNKLISRHPHVFAGQQVSGVDEVLDNWEAIKRAEKQRDSALDGVARSQPALSLASKYLSKNEKHAVGVATPALPDGVPAMDDSEQLGDLLLAIVAVARTEGLDAEAALRAAADRFAASIREAELRM